MKKLFTLFAFLILITIAFVGGIRFDQIGSIQSMTDNGDRRILHYVDPMNPANTSREPGIAPCGMPMEPVYADDETIGGADSAHSISMGTVKINTQKQQITGVQTEEVIRATGNSRIRALGRIAPDENKVYALVAATDGWMGEIHESTTGSLVDKNQLMGKIRVYDYDFFTWQQRYLTELGNAGRRTVFLSNTSGAEEQMKKVLSEQHKTGSLFPDFGAPIALPSDTMHSDGNTMKMSGTAGADVDPTTINEKVPELPTGPVPDLPTGPVPDLPMGPVPEMPMGTAPDMPLNDGLEFNEKKSSSVPNTLISPKIIQEVSSSHAGMTMPEKDKKPQESANDHANHMQSMEKTDGLFYTAEDDVLYASKARQELMDLGVINSQLARLAETGVYLTYIELRSPVDGLVLSRNVTTRQRISRGAECFRVADLSGVWVETDIYDIEAEYIQPGMEAMVSMPNMQQSLPAKVSEVLPRYDAVGRSLKVRLEMDNPNYMFRPDMFVDVEFLLDLPQSITVPSGAVIDSGKRKTVYVVTGEGVFEPREVVTGWRFNSRVEIVKGLRLGERIVISGNFLIDSESRMKLAAARLMEDYMENPLDHQMQEIPETQSIQQMKKNNDPEPTVIDPVCGMNIDPNNAREAGLIIQAEGKMYYFCSEECALEFHRHGPQSDESKSSDQMPPLLPDKEKKTNGHEHMDHKPS